MPWYAYVLIALLAISALATVSRVGQPRQPLDGPTAALTVLFNGLFIWAIIALAERS